MSPLDDTFLSTSNEGVMLWSLHKTLALGFIQLKEETSICAAYDPSGLVFAVGMNSNSVRLYDIKEYANGPFSTFSVDMQPAGLHCAWYDIEFSKNGKLILISTFGNVMFIIDAFDGILNKVLKGHSNIDGSPIRASFTPDAQYVVAGIIICDTILIFRINRWQDLFLGS